MLAYHFSRLSNLGRNCTQLSKTKAQARYGNKLAQPNSELCTQMEDVIYLRHEIDDKTTCHRSWNYHHILLTSPYLHVLISTREGGNIP